MIIYLYGLDSYRRREKLNEYLKRYKAKYPAFSLSYFYLSGEGELEKLKDFSKAISLFDKSKLGVVFEGSSLEEKEQKEWQKILKDNLKTKDLTLIVCEDKKPLREFSFLLGKPAVVHEFESLSETKLRIFLKKEASKRNLKFDKESEDLLAEIYKNDSWGLITELDKLSLLDEKQISREILENHINISLPINVFDILSQIRNSRSVGRRLMFLDELLLKGAEPAMIFNLFSVLMKYPEEKIKMADYDAAVKSGKLEYEEVLLDIALKP